MNTLISEFTVVSEESEIFKGKTEKQIANVGITNSSYT